MEKIVIKDLSVEKAIQKGLIKLGITRDEAVITVVDEGKKGLFGFGKRDAVVELSPKEPSLFDKEQIKSLVQEAIAEVAAPQPVTEETPKTVEEKPVVAVPDSVQQDDENESAEDVALREEGKKVVCDYLTSIATVYGAPATVSVQEKEKRIVFQIESPKAGLLIGKHGKIINALQVLAQTMLYRYDTRRITVIVNVGDYRNRRETQLKQIADRTAEQVLRTKQPVFLEPLPASERKIIHARLSRNKRITTHSEGNEPHRYLVVELAE